MRALQTVGRLIAKFASLAASLHREPEFTCLDCVAWKRCDRSSSDHCALREIQIARGNRRRTTYLGLPWPRSNG
jgi:hypothetical protein